MKSFVMELESLLDRKRGNNYCSTGYLLKSWNACSKIKQMDVLNGGVSYENASK